MNCDSVRQRLSLLLYSELSFEEEDLVERHLGQCAACRAEMAREQRLHRLADEGAAEPPAGLVTRCRSDLRGLIATEPPPGRRLASGLLGFLDRLLPAGPAVLRPVGALALVLLGFFAARISIPPPAGGPGGPALDPAVSRVRWVEPDAASGRVRIVIEETRQRVLTGRPDDRTIRSLLLAAASDPADPGLRADTMDILRTRSGSAEVREALVAALRSDPNAGVRLKAIEGLKPFASDPEIRKTLAQVLLADDNPGVRTQAIDLLIQHKASADVGVLQQLLAREDNEYVRLRTQRALREMNASVESF